MTRPAQSACSRTPPLALSVLLLLLLSPSSTASAAPHRLSDERIVLQTAHGDLELAVWPDVAPRTAAHILELARLGCYNTCHFFRVDKGFVAQTADVGSARQVGLDARQQAVADRRVPLEVRADVRHTRRGLLSMARTDDPDSGGSSFSVMLGPAPHLDLQYTAFGEVVAGLEVLGRLEALPTRREGIFVMPTERVTIHSSYVHCPACEQEAGSLRARLRSQAHELQRLRSSQLP